MTDRFPARARRAVERRFLDAGDELRAALVYESMMAVNMAEDSIHTAADRLRDRAAEADRLSEYLESLGIGQVAEDMTKAIARRQAALRVLARCLTADEIKAAQAGHDGGGCRYGLDDGADCTCPPQAATA
jgi:hypothetical protein